MEKLQLYTVGSYTFSLTMDESEPIWQNMQPSFHALIENNPKQPLFNLIIKEELTGVAITPIYIEHNSKPEVSKLNVYRTESGYMFEIIAVFPNKLIEWLYKDNDLTYNLRTAIFIVFVDETAKKRRNSAKRLSKYKMPKKN